MASNSTRSRWLAPLTTAVLVLAWAHGCGGDETENPTGSSSSTASSGAGAGGNTSSSASGTGGSVASGGAGGAGGAGGMTPQAPTNADCSPASGSAGNLKLTEIATGFTDPTFITAPWGDDERMFVTELAGEITLIKNGNESSFLDISSLVDSGGERGLLGLAFHPDYANNGRFFVHHSEAGTGDTVIAEYRRDPANPDLADGTAVATVLTETQPQGNHNGGMIGFSPFDGMLYIGLGDGGGADDTYNNGQTISTLLGAILRIDVATTPYSIPAGNLGGGAAAEIWDYGLRNPWRFSFDICGGDLYIGDVGQDCYEEINVEAAGDGNKNYGWPITEGQHCFNAPDHFVCDLVPPTDCTTTGTELSAVEYMHTAGPPCWSVTGGYVYRGAAIPWLRGAYLYADYCTGQIWSFRWSGGAATDQQELTSDLWQGLSQGAISSFGQDNDGEMYVVGYGGSIYRIEAE
jgi:glucose/arabinose dehydrogenase